MCSSREESPDWLQSFQAPPCCMLTLSSGSDSSPRGSPLREDRIRQEQPLQESYPFLEREKNCGNTVKSLSKKNLKMKGVKRQLNVDHTLSEGKKVDDSAKSDGNGGDGKVYEEDTSEKHMAPQALNHLVLTVSSDSESCGYDSLIKEEKSEFKASKKHEDAVLIGGGEQAPLKKASEEESSRKRQKVGQTPKKEKNVIDNLKGKEPDVNFDVGERKTPDNHVDPHVSTSRLPLVLSDKVHRSKALVECQGESIDLSGDMGAVGRIVVPPIASGNDDMYLDLKGTIYRTTIVPSRTFCIVTFGQVEAKIEAIMNDFIELKPQSNVYEAETMVEGTLDDFLFESEDDAEQMPKASSHQIDQTDGSEEQANGRNKGLVEERAGLMRKGGKSTGGKLQTTKKVRKKSLVSRKTKTKK